MMEDEREEIERILQLEREINDLQTVAVVNVQFSDCKVFGFVVVLLSHTFQEPIQDVK